MFPLLDLSLKTHTGEMRRPAVGRTDAVSRQAEREMSLVIRNYSRPFRELAHFSSRQTREARPETLGLIGSSRASRHTSDSICVHQ